MIEVGDVDWVNFTELESLRLEFAESSCVVLQDIRWVLKLCPRLVRLSNFV